MKPGEREEAEFVRDAIEDATNVNERARKHAEGAFGGNIGNDVSDGTPSGGSASLAAEARGQSAIDRGDPVTQMQPQPVVDTKGMGGMDAEGRRPDGTEADHRERA